MKTLYFIILLLISVSIKSQIRFETTSGVITSLWNTESIYSYYTIKDTVVAKTGAYLTTDISINKSFNVEKIYPNPNKTIVNIIYTVPFQTKINIRIIDISGGIIETVINDEQSIGRYKAEVDISKISTGVYYIEIITEIGCVSSTPDGKYIIYSWE